MDELIAFSFNKVLYSIFFYITFYPSFSVYSILTNKESDKKVDVELPDIFVFHV